MEKRVLLAIALSFLVIYLSQALFTPPKPQQQPQPSTEQSTPSAPAAGTPSPGATPSQPAPALEQPAAQPLIADASERDIVVDTPDVHAVFSTRGAVLKTWLLKRFNGEEGRPLDLIPSRAPAGAARPFTLQTDDAAVNATLKSALFKPSAESLQVTGADATLTFEYKDASGLEARKTFTFSPAQPYVITFTPTVTRGGTPLNAAVVWGPALGTGVVSSGLIYSPAPQPIFYKDREVTRVGFDDIPEQRAVDGNMVFAGVDDHYFLSAAFPNGQPLRVEYEPVPVPLEGSESSLHFVSWAARYPSPPTNAKFFFGPKDFDTLKAIDPEFTYAIDFGMFSWLVVPLLRALKWINGYVGNYGWSIILLTVLINLAMFPLRHKSVVSMRRMQEMQPEVKAIQDRYAKLKMSDPARQKMNVELMNLYRERGVNPASGCVPMLLTMPVLFAFYAMLSVAIELRGAPFVGWIKDLSTYDPYFVTPILMGLTQFAQTKMQPATGDPTQQRMMLMMPLIFMVMLIWAPSGLVLYWTASNVWAIGQQLVTNRLIGPTPQRMVRPPAERRVKNAGGGKTDAAKERK